MDAPPRRLPVGAHVQRFRKERQTRGDTPTYFRPSVRNSEEAGRRDGRHGRDRQAAEAGDALRHPVVLAGGSGLVQSRAR